MNATQLFVGKANSFEPTGVWFCAKCRVCHRTARDADQCCQNYRCERCNQDTGGRSWSVCDDCRAKESLQKEAARFKAAEKVTQWDGWIYCEGYGRDGYCESVDELKDECENDGRELPEYVWTCEAKAFVNATIEDITSSMEDKIPEDFDFDDLAGLDELKAALDAFNNANRDQLAYLPNYKKALVLNTEPTDAQRSVR